MLERKALKADFQSLLNQGYVKTNAALIAINNAINFQSLLNQGYVKTSKAFEAFSADHFQSLLNQGYVKTGRRRL